MTIKDINPGRINCKNITPEEWKLLERLSQHRGWLIPAPADWLAVRGVLALVEIRRGFKPSDDDDDATQIGWPQLKINPHGIKALAERAAGRVYVTGTPITWEALERKLEKEPVYIACSGCDGTGISNLSFRERCPDCDGDGYRRY